MHVAEFPVNEHQYTNIKTSLKNIFLHKITKRGDVPSSFGHIHILGEI